MLLTGEQILAARDRKTVEVDVPEWGKGAKVLIGSMGALDRIEIAEWFENKEFSEIEVKDVSGKTNVITCDSPKEEIEKDRKYTLSENTRFMLMYLTKTILDPKTHLPAFTTEQIEALGAKDPKPLGRIYQAALDLNLEGEENFKEAEKN